MLASRFESSFWGESRLECSRVWCCISIMPLSILGTICSGTRFRVLIWSGWISLVRGSIMVKWWWWDTTVELCEARFSIPTVTRLVHSNLSDLELSLFG